MVSSSSPSQSSGGPQIPGMEDFQHLHIRSSPPPPQRHPFKAMEKQRHPFKAMEKHRHRHRHHGSHSPPPPCHQGGHSPPPHHLGHFAHKHRHHSAPPPSIYPHLCKKDKLRVKAPKHCKKVQKLHRKLMKAPKGAHHHHIHNVCPGEHELGFPADVHHPACCLHHPGLSRMPVMEMLAGLEQHPACQYVAGIGHHGHRRHGPRDSSAVRHGFAAPVSLGHEAKAMPAERPPSVEAAVLPPASANMLLANDDGPAEI